MLQLFSILSRLNGECLSAMTDTNNISSISDGMVLYTQMEIIILLERPLGIEWLAMLRTAFSV